MSHATDSDPALGTQVISQILHVAPRTVAQLIDAGLLGGYAIPGSRTRRVLRSELVAFCRNSNLPASIIQAAEVASRDYRRGPRKKRVCGRCACAPSTAATPEGAPSL